MKFNQQLEKLLKTLDKFTDKEGVLLKQNLKDASEKFDTDLIKLLLSDKDSKAHFFDEIATATVFNYRKFIDYIDDKNFLIDSYTKFSNKVGLTISNKHIQQINEVVLSFPFKDCVLEGGQSKDDEKRQEIFFNEVLAKDEINRLLDKKVITNAKKYTQNGINDEVKFTRDKNGLIKDNLIIKGNNLLALHTLKSNFAGKVKLIYIDPPYNTGNDSFNYNDNFNHSTWLVFMKNRLEIARDLLSDNGVIFVQCDDNEQAYLKVLMDEIFGRSNVEHIVWNKEAEEKSGTLKQVQRFRNSHETINIGYMKKATTIFNKISEPFKGRENELHTANLAVNESKEKTGHPNWMEITSPTGIKWFKHWKFNNEDIKTYRKEGLLYFGKDGNNQPRLILPMDDRRKVYLSSIVNIGSTTMGRRELEDIFNGVQLFTYPKPEALIKTIIEIATQKGDLVLDYHLGSGTTCAVAHKMGRQYIGIEQMDYIEDIAVKRMQKVIDGEQGGISKSVEWQGGEFIYFELDKYNQAFIDKITKADEKNILKLYDEIIDKAFLNYDVEAEKLESKKDEFKTLNLGEQQEFLISILNKNQLYKNLAEMEDKDLAVSNKTKALNKDFYNE